MPRRREIVKREVFPDPKYGNVLLARFINYIMRRGKKSTAERIVYGAIDIIEEKTGQNGLDVVKMILVGADAVQVVGTIYKNSIAHIGSMLKEMETCMEGKGYKSLKDFRGKLSNKQTADPFVYKRAQYVDLLLKSEELFKSKGLM